ncbi:Sodium/calcium exchanger protein-domain-containing protein [Fusarium acuminatum]|uniref:Sodium/calcium exchanger protein-domain-containing protein n=1 Tax=Fusarium acuminatum TaxID=5515 RepID=A0ABZ2XA14_9HYPO
MPQHDPPPAPTNSKHKPPSDDDDYEIEDEPHPQIPQPRRRATRRKSTPSSFAPSERIDSQHHRRPLPRIKLTRSPTVAVDESLSDEEQDGQDEPFAKEDRQQAINRTHPFGIRVWNPPLYHDYNPGADNDDIWISDHVVSSWTLISNILWTLLFGWWLGLLVLFCGIVCLVLARTPAQPSYGRILCSLAGYLFFPFNKSVRYIIRHSPDPEGERQVPTSCQGEQPPYTTSEYGQLLRFPRLSYGSRTRALDADRGVEQLSQQILEPIDSLKPSLFPNQWSAEKTLFSIALYFLLLPAFLLVATICWCLVLPLPMSRMLVRLLRSLQTRALDLSFEHNSKTASSAAAEEGTLLFYNYVFIDIRSWKHSFGGVNIVLINLMTIATLTAFNWLILIKCFHLHSLGLLPSLLFFGSLSGIIPLAYVIGQAVASISTQSSMGTSAAVNAMFSTIFEVIFYCVALRQGKSELVQGCIIGSILAGVLFLPGLSMCCGALKRKTQRFNSKSAGVTSTMLLFAMIGVFSPTLFYAVYGTYVMRCGDCSQNMTAVLQKESRAAIPECRTCSISQQLNLNDPLYVEILKPFSYLCAFLLALAYVIGLWFTLRTHSAAIWNEGKERHHDESLSRHNPTQSHGRHAAGSQPVSKRPSYSGQNQRRSSYGGMVSTPCDVISEAPEFNQQEDHSMPENTTLAPHLANVEPPFRGEEVRHVPSWSRRKSLLVLVTATVFYCLLATILIDAVDTILQEFYIEERFLGLTVFALIPNATEIWNAILFAANGNIALSVEIGSAYALQVCLLQIPSLVFFSAVFQSPGHQQLDHVFAMVLPQWDMFVVIFSVFLHGYMQNEGRSNYFKGSILLLSYVAVMIGFFLSGKRD